MRKSEILTPQVCENILKTHLNMHIIVRICHILTGHSHKLVIIPEIFTEILTFFDVRKLVLI